MPTRAQKIQSPGEFPGLIFDKVSRISELI